MTNEKDTNSDLFHEEQAILLKAQAAAADEAYSGSALLSLYKELIGQYHKLLRLCRKIFRISDSQGLVLQRQQNEMQMLLDNAEQGFLTFGPDLKVNQQYSRECVRIFGRKIAGLSVISLLGQGMGLCGDKEEDSLREVFTLPTEKGRELLQQLSGVAAIDDKTVRVEYKKINREGSGREHWIW